MNRLKPVLQEPCPHLGRRQHTRFLPAKKAVTIFCEKLVKPIANKRGHNNKYICHRPNAAQPAGDPQSGRGMHERPFILNQNYRINTIADAEFRSHFLPDFRLQRREFEEPLAIMPDNKTDGAITKIADAIEQHDRAHSSNSNINWSAGILPDRISEAGRMPALQLKKIIARRISDRMPRWKDIDFET